MNCYYTRNTFICILMNGCPLKMHCQMAIPLPSLLSLLSPLMSGCYVPVAETLLLDHSEVALPALPVTAVMIPHGPGHLLIVHLLRPVGLHPTPRLGKLQRVRYLARVINQTVAKNYI